MKTRSPLFSSSLLLTSLLLGGLAGCATETGGGGAGGTSSQAPDPTPTACGTVTTLTSDVSFAANLAIQGDSILGPSSIGLATVPLAGGATTAVVTDVTGFTMALTSTHIYWSDGPDALWSANTDGSSVTLLAPLASWIEQVVADEDTVYWIDQIADPPSSGNSSQSARVMKVPAAGGAPSEIAQFELPVQLEWNLAIDDTSVYWFEPVAGAIMAVPKAGGTPVALVSGLAFAAHLAVDADNLYWRSGDDHTSMLLAMPKLGGSPTLVASSDVYGFVDFAVGETDIYIDGTTTQLDHPDDAFQGYVLRAPKAGGPLTLLASQDLTDNLGVIVCPGGACWVANTGIPYVDGNLVVHGSAANEKSYVMRWQACP